MSMGLWNPPMARLVDDMKNFSLVTNVYKDKDLQVTKEITAYITSKGGKANLLFTFEGRRLGGDFQADEIPAETECIMVLGGDGTLIRVATRLEKLTIPLVGVNLGKLGYLCELERASVFHAIDRLMEGSYMIEERMMLSGYMSGETAAKSALNDIVIHQTGNLSILDLKVYVNGEILSTYRADGIIVATPTGSTGYSLSAGGPIVDPKARMMLLTPVNAHNLNARSIVLEADAVVEVEIEGNRPGGEIQAAISFDGDSDFMLRPGQRFVVSASADITQICRLNKESFLEIMRKKMENYN